MINQLITWLRRDDERLEILRQEIRQKEKDVNWDQLQTICLYVIYMTIVMGFGVLLGVWIA